LNTVVGLNPKVKPGNEAAHMMVDTLSETIKANPDLLKEYTYSDL